MRFIFMILVTLVKAWLLVLHVSLAGCTSSTQSAKGVTLPPPVYSPSAHGDPKRERFDMKVRDDMFAGMDGNAKALRRAMKLCEDTLAANPQHAEAMVWHGAGVASLAAKAFRERDFDRGIVLWNTAMQELERASALEPNNVGVLIPKGAVLLGAGMQMKDKDRARQTLGEGVAAYEKVLAIQAPYFQKLPVHARGELLIAIAEAHDRLGNRSRAAAYYQRVANECQDAEMPEYAREAGAWLGAPNDSHRPHSCVGCHVD